MEKEENHETKPSPPDALVILVNSNAMAIKEEARLCFQYANLSAAAPLCK